MEIKVYTLNAFAKTDNGGNPAGVVLYADSLSVDDMQKIAAKVSFSETAFVKKSSNADFKVDFFTYYEDTIKGLRGKSLIECTNNKIFLTELGMKYGNVVFRAFIP